MRFLLSGLLLFAFSAAAQLTREQKLQDFQQLASLYAKHYAPYEWKRDTLRFDAMNIGPWLDRVARSKDDLEFHEICSEYLSMLDDGHVNYLLLSDFTATLGFSVDVYDNVLLVDSINRTRLPASRFPMSIGDRLISIDGVPAEQVLMDMVRYASSANTRSTLRVAAGYITSRSQRLIPRAVELKDEAVVVVRNGAGETVTMNIPWVKTGTPLYSAGPVPSPKAALERASRRMAEQYLQEGDAPYMLPLRMLQNARTGAATEAVLGWGARTPLFQMPSGFAQRLGRDPNDFFFSGTFEMDGVKFGFIRVPNFSPPSTTLAVQQFAAEIQYFQANTDGLIVDDTRNTGGNVCLVEQLLSYLIPNPFRGGGYEIRATSYWVAVFSSTVTQLRALGAPAELIEQYEALLKAVQEANSAHRGRTAGLPLCGATTTVQPARDRSGNVLAYTKPVVMLVDELSASSGDLFPALFQDARRGQIIGYRTMGLGGTVITFPDATTFSESDARITVSMMTRAGSASVDGYPSSAYIENVGVRPDLTLDYQTRDNLLSGGRQWIDAAAWLAAQYVKANR